MNDPEEIHVLGKRVRLLQPAGGFRTSLDSVMLAAACLANAGDHILDMGCGVGGAAFCVISRVPGCRVSGIDVQGDYVALAQKNIALNQAEGYADFTLSDIRAYTPGRTFDHVICNPPYLEAGHYTASPDEGRARALGHDDAAMDIKEWIDSGFRLLKSGGSLTVIHRADAADRAIQALGRRFGALVLIPLWPRAGEAAKRVIIRAVKDRKTPCRLHPGIVLHEQDGRYTPAADQILRDAMPIE